MRGFGAALRKAIADWYLSKKPADLAYQLLKYQQRNGLSHRDVLRLIHMPANTAVSRWALGLDTDARAVKVAPKLRNPGISLGASTFGFGLNGSFWRRVNSGAFGVFRANP